MKKQSFRRRKQSAKRRRRRKSFSAIDRLSQLPQPILHNILSLISQKDAVRTSVLSKSWRYLWHGRLNVEFRDRDHWFSRNKKIWSFIDKTLQRYLDQNLSLQKFIVDIFYYDVDFVLLKKWIHMVIMNMGVRSLNLIFGMNSIVFPLPLVVFQSESLVELHLQRCDLSTLESTDNVMLNNLQTLRLHGVNITDEIFEKLILGCPLIENLDMLKCIGLKSIKLHKHHNIKDFGCSVNVPLIIEIEDPHALESLRIENCCHNWFLPHKNMHFPHLKSLTLQRVKLNIDTFSNFSSFFPCLNELIINNCKGLKEFRLLSSSIKRLTIIMDTRNRIKAFFGTPNILYFKYSGHGDAVLPSIKFTTTSNEWKSKISLSCKLNRSDKDLRKLNNLLKALSQSHITVKLFHNVFRKQLHINDSYGGFYKPVVVEHLKLKRFFTSYLELVMLNCFFRICHPLYIYMDTYDDLRDKCIIVEYVSKLISDETGPCLEEVSIEVWDMKAKEWHCVKGTIYTAMRCKQLIRFQLTWKEQ
ncbi:hypothetical protein CASFOL_021911 [Castilleja foliolosa]|uniref:F-box domain-containing protein n=1 Tax=Castilleja foliolosa TaxID=1961234 RepID=A0ABD3CYV2_9LAMI